MDPSHSIFTSSPAFAGGGARSATALLAGPGGGGCWATSILASASITAWLSWESGIPALACASRPASVEPKDWSAWPGPVAAVGAWLLAVAWVGAASTAVLAGEVGAQAFEDEASPGDANLG